MSQAKQSSRTVLGFDCGTKKVGIAVGQEVTCTATPLVTLIHKNNKPDWEAISQIFQEWQPDLCVVGLPLFDGEEQPMTQVARRFGNQLKGRYNLPVEMMNEELSSRETASILRDSPNHGRKLANQPVDHIAAQLILQSWLNTTKQNTKRIDE